MLYLVALFCVLSLPGISSGSNGESYLTGNFEARATRSGVIIIEVPKDENGNYVLDGIKHLVYKWNGEAYVLNEQQRRRLSQ